MPVRFITVHNGQQNAKLPVSALTTFDAFLRDVHEALHLSLDEDSEYFAVWEYLFGNHKNTINNEDDFSTFLATTKSGEMRIILGNRPVHYCKLGVHPVYELISCGGKLSWSNILEAARERFGDKVQGEINELHLVTGDQYLHISSAVEWRTIGVPSLAQGRFRIREAPAFHVGPVGPTPLTAPALSHFTASVGTLSLFSPSALSTVDSASTSGDAQSTTSGGTVFV